MRALCLLVCLLLIAKTKSLHSVDDFQFEVGDDLQVQFILKILTYKQIIKYDMR